MRVLLAAPLLTGTRLQRTHPKYLILLTLGLSASCISSISSACFTANSRCFSFLLLHKPCSGTKLWAMYRVK